MKVIVSIKAVPDYEAKVSIKPDRSGVDTDHLACKINPFDEIALEAALQWREKGIIHEVIAVCIGKPLAEESLRKALAMGADSAILLTSEKALQPLPIARLLATVVQEQQADCVIMGKQAVDRDNHQTPQMLAALLDWPQATCVSKLELDALHASVVRETDKGLETLQLTLPAVISVDLGLNLPRFITLPNIIKAKNKPLKIESVDDSGVDLSAGLQTLCVEKPPRRNRGEIKNSIQEILDVLQQG